ncbi:hypothetical protein QVD17_19494 [Tagetes erecta]|uniref:Pyridine nucleotide-disulphide oxidoreductase dimerisation domain-containing protein n=1 Tax=Tagetes erecta TaxID=13708 RepID=A0AAD8NX99_TARER|nr:hypothetical protein QVD17_19494 [Tagetes erecta]
MIVFHLSLFYCWCSSKFAILCLLFFSWLDEAEARAKHTEEEIARLQKSLDERNQQLQASSSDAAKYLRDLDDLTSQLTSTKATAEASAASAQSAQLQCKALLKELDEKEQSLREHEARVNKLGEQLDSACAKTNQVVGLHMCGEDSAEVVQGFAVAIKAGLTKAQFDSTVGIYSSYINRGICHHEDTYKENSKFFIWGRGKVTTLLRTKVEGGKNEYMDADIDRIHEEWPSLG